MKREFTYIENYEGVKIYQYDDDKTYTATVYTNTFIRKDLKDLKIKIDEIINEHIEKFRNLD